MRTTVIISSTTTSRSISKAHHVHASSARSFRHHRHRVHRARRHLRRTAASAHAAQPAHPLVPPSAGALVERTRASRAGSTLCNMPETPAKPDTKPRSRTVTDGIEALTSRGMLRAVVMGDADWEKPQIGIASSWNEITPCNLSLDRLAQASKEGVHSGGGYPLQFGTISVSDGISMGHEGMHFSLVSREVIADSVEVVMQAERLDGSVLLAGCDKSLPGMLMAAGRLDLASVFLYAGATLPGKLDGNDVTIIDAFEGVGACARG